MKRKKLKQKGTIHDTLTGYDFTIDTPLRPLRAIREKCLECCCLQQAEVKRCHIQDCTLWPYRMGRRPNHAGKGPQKPDSLSKNPVKRSDLDNISSSEG